MMRIGFLGFSQLSSTLLIGKVGRNFSAQTPQLQCHNFVIKIVLEMLTNWIRAYLRGLNWPLPQKQCPHWKVDAYMCFVTQLKDKAFRWVKNLIQMRMKKSWDEDRLGVKSIVALRTGSRGLFKEQTAPRNLPSKWALAGQKIWHFLPSLKI